MRGIYIDESHTKILLERILACRRRDARIPKRYNSIAYTTYLCNVVRAMGWPGALQALHEMLSDDGISLCGRGFGPCLGRAEVDIANAKRDVWLRDRIARLK